jgi:hypothetical protein
VSAKGEARSWAETVAAYANERGLRYEPVGGLNPAGGPAALLPGGANRLTGELVEGFWGASCDAEEREEGGLFSKAVVPHAILAKAHTPDLAEAMPQWNVESIEARPGDIAERTVTRNKVEFESLEFNGRYLATVPSEYDPVALREMFSPGFLDWATTIDREVDFGVSEQQFYFLWRMRERSEDELKLALRNAGELFERVRRELDEHSEITAYPAGPWHAGLEAFPGRAGAGPLGPEGS